MEDKKTFTIHKNNEVLVATDDIKIAIAYANAIILSKLIWKELKVNIIDCFCCRRPLVRGEGLGVSLDTFKYSNMFINTLLPYIALELIKNGQHNVEEIIDGLKKHKDFVHLISLKYAKGNILLCNLCFKKYIESFKEGNNEQK